MNQPVHNGMRPDIVNLGRDRPMIETDTGEIEDIYDDMDDFRSKRLVYKRAESHGSSQSGSQGPLPSHGLYSGTPQNGKTSQKKSSVVSKVGLHQL